MSGVRVRFAPSPSGVLHVGSARTALLNWLFARSAGGRILLRIDDTDGERSSDDYEAAILEDLVWLGLTWDEGPVRQSSRLERYAQALAGLGTERRDGAHEFEGRVIARADGSPLYHLATAVDDIDDEISHVLRGRDHLPNTELQVAIIRALGAEPPEYVHAPLLVLADGAKASKREGDAGEGSMMTVAALRDAGYPPAAICNALALSLADFGTDEVMLTLDVMAERFDLGRLHSADSQFDAAKLDWISGEHIKAMDDTELAAGLAAFGVVDPPEPALIAARTAGATFSRCAEVIGPMVAPPPHDDAAIAAIDVTEVGLAWAMLDEIISDWPPSVEQAESAVAELKRQLRADGFDLGVSLRGLRAVLTGQTEGPELPLLLACVSQQRWDAAGH